MIGINLNKDISCEYVCKIIHNLVNNYIKENGSVDNSIITINITKCIDSDIKPKILNIESC